MNHQPNNLMVYTSGSQTCSNRYPNHGSDYVLLPSKIFSHFRLKISIAVITYDTDQHCDFSSALPTVE